MAFRVKDDLLRAVREADPTALLAAAKQGAADAADQISARGGVAPGATSTDLDEITAAADLLGQWDNTTASDSRGGVLFKVWYYRYFDLAIPESDDRPFNDRFNALFEEPWSAGRPTDTPRGLADPDAAALAFAGAVAETKRLFGSWDVPWGEVHRYRLGDLDLPANGCSGTLGCFRVTYYDEADDGKQVTYSGDGWVLAVEFGEVPKAYSVLAYGQSSRPDSPHLTDQLEMFARGEMKRVVWTEAEIERDLVRSYRPGIERRAGAAEPGAASGGGD